MAGTQSDPGFRVVKILWTADRVPSHALDLPGSAIICDPTDHIGYCDLPISRGEAMQVCAELNDETLSTWLESSWHAVFEVHEPEECWGQIFRTEDGRYEEDWCFYRSVSLVVPTAEEVSALCVI